jgi:nitronate monooxygenase
MAGATTPELVAAVSEVGGLGSFGAAATPPDRLRAVIQSVRQQTERPFNINLFVPDWDPALPPAADVERMRGILKPIHEAVGAGEVPEAGVLFGHFEEQLDLLVEEKVPVVSFHFGAPATAVERCKSAGAIVLSSATTVAEARTLVDNGVDIIIAQGAEAGGHRGTFQGEWAHALIGTLALVPQIVDAVDVPVVAAGGIMDGRGVAAVLALGAGAAQMGTAFLCCPENSIAEAYKQAILDSAEERPEVTTAFSGKPARGLRNTYMDALRGHEDALLPFPSQYSIFGALRAHATQTNDGEYLPMWSGQGVGLATQEPAGDLVTRVTAECDAILGGLSVPADK